MIYKLIEIITSFPQRVIWLGNKPIIIEERFGKRKEIIKNYRITSIYMENDGPIINYILVGYETFVYSSLVKDLSKEFISQILVSII